MGVTQLDDIIYVVCNESVRIRRFKAATHEQLNDIDVNELKDPKDMAACEQTSQVYVADSECVWRMSADSTDVQRWLTSTPSGIQLRPHTLSVTATRLLVTSYAPNELMQFDADGTQLGHVRLPEGTAPYHAVESQMKTFVILHSNTQLEQWQVSEFSTGGQVLRQFSGQLSWPQHIAVSSQGNVMVADTRNRRILLLSDRLVLRRVIMDEHLLSSQEPRRLCYVRQSEQLFVGFDNSVAAFDVLQMSQLSQITLSHGIFLSIFL